MGAVRDMMQIPASTLASETLTHPAQGTANSTNNAGLSGLGKKREECVCKNKTKKPQTVPIAQLRVCLLLSYRNGAIFSLLMLMALEKDANSGHREVGTQEQLYVLDSIMMNSEAAGHCGEGPAWLWERLGFFLALESSWQWWTVGMKGWKSLELQKRDVSFKQPAG